MLQLDAATAAAVSRRLAAAFPPHPCPVEPSDLAGNRWFDERGTMHVAASPEAEEVARFFGGRRWVDIDPAELLGWDHASVSPIFLRPRARAYYLPAYLRAFLERPLDGLAIAVLEGAIRSWTPPDAVAGRRWNTRTESQRQAMEQARSEDFRQFVDALTRAQKAVLAESLEVFAPPFDDPDFENPVRRALDVFWAHHRDR